MDEMVRVPIPMSGITISDAVADCDTVTKQQVAGGSLGLIANTTITTLTLYTTHDGTNWGKCQNSGSDVTMAVTKDANNKVFAELPDAVFKFPVLRFVSQAGATDEAATVWLSS